MGIYPRGKKIQNRYTDELAGISWAAFEHLFADGNFRPHISKSQSPSLVTLTARERQVIQLLGEGKTTKEVASVLGISSKTASAHRERLMKKLDVHETAGLVRYAIRMGLVLA